MNLCFSRETFNLITDVCEKTSNDVKLYKGTQKKIFNLKSAFTISTIKLGQGGFGVVKQVNFGLFDIPIIAVKQIIRHKFDVKELETIVNLNEINVGPKFYFCQYDDHHVYIAQEIMFKTITNPFVRLYYYRAKCSQFLQMARGLFLEINQMFDMGYVHNDIKGDNIMVNRKINRFTLIDFGVVSKTSQFLKARGTLKYMSPRKWINKNYEVIPLDDYYSLAIVLAQMNIPYSTNILFLKRDKYDNLVKVHQDCWDTVFLQKCQDVLEQNVVTIMSEANFGKYQTEATDLNKEKINFTTLLGKMIKFWDFPFTYEETIEIIDRLILEFKAKEAKEEELFKNKKYVLESDIPVDDYDYRRYYNRIHPDYYDDWKMSFDEFFDQTKTADYLIYTEIESKSNLAMDPAMLNCEVVDKLPEKKELQKIVRKPGNIAKRRQVLNANKPKKNKWPIDPEIEKFINLPESRVNFEGITEPKYIFNNANNQKQDEINPRLIPKKKIEQGMLRLIV